ncbi:MAG: nuclear transport factor 2 family protein [Solirubrobacterales bacterium]
MSEENVEIVRSMNNAYLLGDVAGALEALDDHIVWHGTVGGLDEGDVHRGREEVVKAFADNFEAWERLTLDYEEYFDAGSNVVVFVHEIARGRKSGVEIETDTAIVFAVEGGKITRAQAFMDRGAALEAAGLTE